MEQHPIFRLAGQWVVWALLTGVLWWSPLAQPSYGQSDGTSQTATKPRAAFEEELNRLAEAARQASFRQATDTVSRYLTRARLLAELSLSDRLMGRYYLERGILHLNKGEYAPALELFNTAQDHYQKANDTEGIINSLKFAGIVYNARAEYDKALAHFFRARELASTSPELGTGGIDLNIGNSYRRRERLRKALTYYRRSYNSFAARQDSGALPLALTNLGIIFNQLAIRDTSNATPGEHTTNTALLDSAIHYFKASLAYDIANNETYGISANYNNLGNAYGDLGNSDSSIYYFEQSLELDRQMGKRLGVATSLNNLSQEYLKKGEPARAEAAVNEALTIAENLGDKRLITHCLKNYSSILEALGKYRQALSAERRLRELQLELLDLGKAEEIGKMEAQHELKLREQQESLRRERLRKAQQQRNEQQYLLISAALILLIFSVLLLSRLNIKRQVVEVMLFLGLLIFFEFALVAIDPWLEEYTGGVPLPKLGFNLVLAVGFTFLHRAIERWYSKRKGE